MNTLNAGSQLFPGQSVTSSNGHYALAFQFDGNVVLYVNYRGLIALWDTQTNGKPATVLDMQNDGNLVLYDSQQHPLFNSVTEGHPGAFLTVQDDGNLVIYAGNTPIWATNTAGSDPLEGVSTIQNVVGVSGVSSNPNTAGVSGSNPGGLAGFFDGNVTVTGDIFLSGADCAEHFDVIGRPPEPGTVVVIDQDGALRGSKDAYDKKVAGVISGAGEYRHGIILDKRSSKGCRVPVALVGKVYCKVDAQYAPIEVGDLLTTSATEGHAMKALDPLQAFGCVIGKALRPLERGQGLIPILIALQ